MSFLSQLFVAVIFFPRDISNMPVIKLFLRLDLEEKGNERLKFKLQINKTNSSMSYKFIGFFIL